MRDYLKSREILERNQKFIFGGVVSVNRAVEPNIVFTKGGAPICGTRSRIVTLIIMAPSLPICLDITILTSTLP